ncbi:hypothetical protein PRZ48_008252 [Zasmidium cellare]|uniref:RNase III domain-containing protein n=1 Tax=Zasmidium cellare TaxID=395010 RepID=A0ABR0EFM2_ZASCE|nr:hypothetical protein PRZ48_008252 [Zasmidium cellare]
MYLLVDAAPAFLAGGFTGLGEGSRFVRARRECFDARRTSGFEGRRCVTTEAVAREGGEFGAPPAISNEVEFDDGLTEASAVDSEEADVPAATSSVSSETAESDDVPTTTLEDSNDEADVLTAPSSVLSEAAEFENVPTTTLDISNEEAEFDSVSTASPTISSEAAEFDSVSTTSPTIPSEEADFDHVSSTPLPALSQGPRLQVNDSKALLDFDSMRQRVENLIQYQFQDLDYLRLALYPGDAHIDDHMFPKTQFQLAQVGDAVHKLLYFSDQFPWSGGAINTNFNMLGSNLHFARIAKRHGLGSMRRSTLGLAPNPKAGTAGIWHDATLIEAIIGAVYLDSGRNEQTTRTIIDTLQLGQLTTIAEAYVELQSTSESSVEVNSSETTDKTRSILENAPAPSHRLSRKARKTATLRRFLPDEPESAELKQLVRVLTARLKLASSEDQIHNHLDEIMRCVAMIHPGNRGYEAVEELREQIRNMQGTASTGDGIETGSDDAGTTREHEAGFDNQVSLPSNSTSGDENEPVLDAAEANGSPTNETRSPRRTLQLVRKKERKSLLRKHLPAGSSDWTFSQLTKALSAKLAAAPVDDAIYDDLDSVMAALRPFKSGDPGFEGAKELRERIRKLQNKERPASTQKATDVAGGGETGLPQSSLPAEHDASSAIPGINEKLNDLGFASPQTLSLRVDHPLMSRFNSIRQRIEAITQYRFKDPDYLKAAVAPEVAFIGQTSLPKPRIELALIGDSIYKAVFFVDRFPSAGSMRSSHSAFERVSTNVHFCKRARRLNLSHLAGTMEGRLAAQPSPKEIWNEATLIEALIGAIYVDSGYSLSALMRAIHAMDLFTPTGFGQRKISAATGQQRVWSMDALSNSLKVEVASANATGTEPSGLSSQTVEDVLTKASASSAHNTEYISAAPNQQGKEEGMARRRVTENFAPSANGTNTESSTLPQTMEDGTTEPSTSWSAYNLKNLSEASNQHGVEEERARQMVIQKCLPRSVRGFALHNMLFWIKARVSRPEFRDTFFQHKDELESVLRSYGPGTPPYGLSQDILQLLRLEGLRRSMGTSDDTRASANSPSEPGSTAASDLEPLSDLETPANDNITKRPLSTISGGIRQRRRRQRLNDLRKHFPDDDGRSTVTGLLAKIQERRAKLMQDPNRASELQKVELVLEKYRATGGAVVLSASGKSKSDNVTERALSTSRDGIRQRLARHRKSALRTQVPGANKYTPIPILLEKIQQRRKELLRDPSRASELREVENVLEEYRAAGGHHFEVTSRKSDESSTEGVQSMMGMEGDGIGSTSTAKSSYAQFHV